MPGDIETVRLRLVPCSLAILEAVTAGTDRLAALLDLAIAGGWPEFPEAFDYSLPLIRAEPDLTVWWAYLFVERSEQTVIGSGGYKGRPEGGMIEIGYEIAPAYRNRGYATEAATGLVQAGFAHPEVRLVQAHTLPERNASVHVLEKIGMRFAGPVGDPNDGPVWRWELWRKAESGPGDHPRAAGQDLTASA